MTTELDRQLPRQMSVDPETIRGRGRRCANRSSAPRPPLALFEGSRPVDSIHAPSDIVAPPSDNHGFSLLDGCPSCVTNTETPHDTEPTTNGFHCAYRCTDCGHAWTTDWSV